MDNRRIIIGYLLIILLFCFEITYAFDAIDTHPKLTEEAVKFYNFYSNRRKINDQELEWLKEGSKNE
jgi:hypothetical protein